jgi:hypothetical protein
MPNLAKMLRQADGYYSVVYNGRVVLQDEGYQVAANVEWFLNNGAPGVSECDEIAQAILAEEGGA